MWSRAELKANAKNILKGSYWDSVAAVLICFGISLGISLVFWILSFIPFVGIAALIFLSLPIIVGLNYFFMQNQVGPPSVQNVFYAFQGGRYMKIVGAMAWMYLFIFLWSLIACAGFIIVLVKGLSSFFALILNPYMLEKFTLDSSWIPALVACGVIYLAGFVIVCIKSLSYSMTAYILTDNPMIGYDRALKLSIAMTHGQKWEMFVLYLSFLGWCLLAVLTAGIGYIFLAPYILATQAQLYVKLRDLAIRNSLTTAQELNVYPTYEGRQ